MASARPPKPAHVPPTAEEERIIAHCQREIARAEEDRGRHQKRINDCYKLALPWRHKIGERQSTNDLDEIFDSIAMTVVEDFAADMLNTFTPVKAEWLEVKPVETLAGADQAQIADDLARYQTVVFSEMRRSNLYAALQETYLDLAVGTMAIIIQDRHPTEPIFCQAIPISDLLITRDPWGGTGGKWRRWHLSKESVPLLWPKAKAIDDVPPPAKGDKNSAPAVNSEIEITEGLYRDWSDRGNEKWDYVVFTGAKLLLHETYTGEGSSPIIVSGWSRDSTTAWRIGPLYRSMPDVKTVNHVCYLGLKNLDLSVDPVTSYEDDGVMNVDAGVNPGDWIPRGSGSKAPVVLESKARFDLQFAQMDQLRSAIRRAHYQDRPEQQGKTPPTATQWADEAAERARRMGTPATNLVHEWQYPIFRRFAYLLHKRGKLPKVKLNGDDIALQPVSPLLRAQEQEEVVRITKFLEIGTQNFGPQAMAAFVKMDDTLRRIADKLGVPSELVRDQVEAQQMMANMAQAAQAMGAMGGGEQGGAPAAPAPA